jgi:hypothetical protein
VIFEEAEVPMIVEEHLAVTVATAPYKRLAARNLRGASVNEVYGWCPPWRMVTNASVPGQFAACAAMVDSGRAVQGVADIGGGWSRPWHRPGHPSA